jgi:hypothetical protein
MSDDAALARMDHSDRLIRRRQIDSEERKVRRQTEASIADKDAMERQHQLNIENRSIDHNFNRAEDARELQRLASETALKRRDDFVREQWGKDRDVTALEAEIISKVADAKVARRQTELEQANALELATHENELDKDNFEFKERLKIELAGEYGQFAEESVEAAFNDLKKSGKI